MESANSTFNLATIALLVMAGAIIVSVLTLVFYFFGGSGPLERNALGRVEAALAPADVLRAQRQFRSQRIGMLIFAGVVTWAFLHQAAPAQTEQATASFFEAVAIAAGSIRDAGVAVAQELGIGNECECSDPSRIGRYGP